jgi:hypothetical protein
VIALPFIVLTGSIRHTICGTLWNWPLPAATANAHAVDAEALFGPVSEAASLIRSGRTGGAVDDV